jgi:glycolate oxidase iron-sulfur subunit
VIEKLGIKTFSFNTSQESIITYPDSCLAIRGLNIKEAPREILKSIPGVNLVEMKDADSCCGGAGSYCFSHPTMSGRIVSEKVKNIKDTNANLVSTSCPACTMQIGAGLNREGIPLTIMHPVELLAKAEGLTSTS